MIRFSPILAVFASLTLSPITMGATPQSVCFLPNNVPAQPSKETWEQIRPILAKQFDACLGDSDYFALYGAALLYTGDIARALEMLERSLLIDPDNGSARIDYAQALFQSGQLLAAIQVNQNLLDEENVPPAIHQFLKDRDAAWQERLHYWRHQFSYLYGHSSNLNNATDIEELYFSFPGLSVSLPLDPSSRAKPGNYYYAGLLSQYYNLQENGVSLASLSLKTRESNLNSSDTDELKVSYEREIEKLSMRHNWSVSAEHLRLGDRGLYSAVEGTWRLNPRTQPDSYLELDTRYVDFNGVNRLDEISYTIRPGVAFTHALQRFGFELGFGINKAIDDRDGGDRSQQEASAFYDTSLLGGRLSSRITYSQSLDADGYNPLIQSNARRKTQSLTTTLQYFYPINKDWIVHGSYYHRDQESNIDLFDTKTESIDLGFTYRF